MRYADSLLADGEIVVRRARQHWLALILDARRGWVLGIIAVLGAFVGYVMTGGNDPLRTMGYWIEVVALIGIAIALADVIYHAARWRSQDYLVTNRRVIQVEGILNKRSADSSLEKINDAILDQNVLARMFGYGDLDILTASESAIDRFRMLAQAADFKREMLNQKHALEIELTRSPSPPLRAEMPLRADVSRQPEPEEAAPVPEWMEQRSAAFPGQPAAAPAAAVSAPMPAPSGGGVGVAAPPAPAAPRIDSEQVTATLGRLADLRDRGAITPEEFEAKKAELLSRL